MTVAVKYPARVPLGLPSRWQNDKMKRLSFVRKEVGPLICRVGIAHQVREIVVGRAHPTVFLTKAGATLSLAALCLNL